MKIHGKFADAIEGSAENLMILTNLCFKAVHKAHELPKKDKSIATAVLPLTWMAGELAGSLSVLSRIGKFAPSLAISRSVFESALNACFVLAKGTTAANDALSHYRQKTFRDLKRELKAGKLRLEIVWSGEAIPSEEMKRALSQFTTAKGSERRSWTTASIEDRIAEVTEAFGTTVGYFLLFGLVATYRYGSEVIHGTLFGAMYVFSLAEAATPASSPEEAKARSKDEIMFLCSMSCFVLCALLKCLEAKWGESFESIVLDADEAMEAQVQLMKGCLSNS